VAAAINAAACELTRVYVLLKPTGRKPVDGCQEVVQGVNVDLEPNVDDLEAGFVDPVDHRARFLAPIFLAPKTLLRCGHADAKMGTRSANPGRKTTPPP
jgi:hypothetical protein